MSGGGPNPGFENRAVFVIDVQQGLIAGPDAVPDALEVRQAIHHIVESVRQHNDTVQLNNESSGGRGRRRRIRIVFVQHNDKDPEDPIYPGKPTWELMCSPRKDDDAELLVFKAVGNVFEGNGQLGQELRLQGITCLAVTGLQSDCCVRASILGAIASGFDAANITLLRGTHSTFDTADASKSYSQIKQEVEEELAGLGVQLQEWQTFTPSLDM